MRPTLLLLDVFYPYILYDTFTDVKAAGIIGNSLADSGQPRAIVDANSRLSLSGGSASFATGGAGANDPSINYPKQVRISGKILLASITLANTTGSAAISWSAVNGGTQRNGIYFFADGTIRVNINNGGTIVNTGLTYTATTYSVAIVMRSVGAFVFIKGGTYTNWTLVYSTQLSSSDVFPNVSPVTGTVTIVTVDNIRIPNAGYLPYASAADAFTRANGAIGSTDGLSNPENRGGSSLVWTGSTWTIVSNAVINTPTLSSDVISNGGFTTDTVWTKEAGWTISGGTAVATAAASGTAIYQSPTTLDVWYQVNADVVTISAGQVSPYNGGAVVVNPAASTTGAKLWVYRAAQTRAGFQARVSALTATLDNETVKPLTLSQLFASLASGQSLDVQIHADLTIVSGTQMGVVLNLDSAATPANFVIGYHDGVNARLDKCVAGTYTSMISAATTYVAGATLLVIKTGTKYTLIYNNVIVGTVQTISDAGIISNTIHGLFSTYSGNSADNFVVRPMGTANEYYPLDAF